tara:strand:- start:1039 stop:1455 length:417 start_codon:yes stop_codon:yes gene_type:complete
MFNKQNKKDEKKLIFNTTSLLLKVASADQIIKKEELDIIKEIISEFFSITATEADSTISEAIKMNKESIDLFEAGSYVNDILSLQDKIDFILCIYEVAYVDNNLDFLERHIINQIINILNINKEQIKIIQKDVQKKLL